MSAAASTSNTQRYAALIESLPSARIGVVGDLAADVYVAGLTDRVSREAPVLIIRHEREWTLPGCAANTAANARALGASVELVGLLGQDQPGRELFDQLRERGIGTEGVVRSSQIRTVSKTRFLAGARSTSRQQVMRLDCEPASAPPDALRIALRTRVQQMDERVDVWVVSDYGYRSVDDDLKRLLREIAQQKPVIVDSRYDALSFRGVTVIKPNEDEAIAATGVRDGSIEQMRIAAAKLTELVDVDTVLVTLGNQGMLLHHRAHEPVLLPAAGTDEIVDLTGAGDTVAATFAVAIAADAGYEDAAYLSNCAAGLAVMKEGPATITCAELGAAVATGNRKEESAAWPA